LIIKLLKIMGRKRWAQLAFLAVVMVFSSVAEVVSIAAIIPLLEVLTSPDKFSESKYGSFLLDSLRFLIFDDVMLSVVVLFVAAVLLAGIIRTSLVWFTTNIAFSIGADLSLRIYNNILMQPYLKHLTRNSSDVITGITTKTDSAIYNSIYPIITIASSLILVFVVVVALFAINPLVAGVVFLGLGGAYTLAMLVTKKILANIGKVIATHQTQRVKVIQEGLGGIRDVILDSTHQVYGDIYKKIDRPLRNAQRLSSFLANVPRYGIETLALILFSGVAYWLTLNDTSTESVVPVLAATALGAQRIMPSLQTAYHSWTFLLSGKESLKDVLDLLAHEKNCEPGLSVPNIFRMVQGSQRLFLVFN
jgi:ATP-binding cassette, subfamily B, bacterial PglK